MRDKLACTGDTPQKEQRVMANIAPRLTAELGWNW